MDDTIHLDRQLTSMETAGADSGPMDFPPALASSLRRRRIHRRVKAGLALISPVVVFAAALLWMRPVPDSATASQEQSTSASILRADPSKLPDGVDWQLVRIERAGGPRTANFTDF